MAGGGKDAAAGAITWPRRRRWLAALAVLVVSAGVYLNTASCGFTWDDQWLILDNYRLTEPSERWNYVKYMLFEGALWRPVKRISLLLDYSIYGPHARGFHGTNIALQAAVCLALFALGRRLSGNDRIGLAAALLFAVHPIHTEAIANISHRKEPLSLLFYLLAFLAYLEARAAAGAWPAALEASSRASPPPPPRTAKVSWPRAVFWLLVVLLCYLLGMLSKEVGAVMLPATIVVYELALRGPTLAAKLRRLLPLALPAIPVLVLFTIKGYIKTIPRRFDSEMVLWITNNETSSYFRVVLGAMKAFWTYLHLLVWPWPLYLDRAFVLPHGPFEPEVLAGFASLALYGAALHLTWSRSRLAFFGLAWYGINLLPVLNLVPLTHWLVAERFVYVPSAGIAVVAAVGFEHLWQAGTRARAGVVPGSPLPALGTLLFVAVFAGHGALTVWQNRVWTNSTTLWAHTLQYNQKSYRALYGYGLELSLSGNSAEAERYYRRTIDLMPSYPEAHYALGLLCLNLNRYEEAIREATLHADLAPKDPEPFIVIGNAHFALRHYRQAAAAYARAVERKPNHMDARFNLANALHAAGDSALALAAIDEALRIRRDPQLYLLRGNVLDQLGRGEEAVQMYHTALDLDPDSVDAANDLAQSLVRLGRYQEAAVEIERSLALRPDQPRMKQILDGLAPHLQSVR